MRQNWCLPTAVSTVPRFVTSQPKRGAYRHDPPSRWRQRGAVSPGCGAPRRDLVARTSAIAGTGEGQRRIVPAWNSDAFMRPFFALSEDEPGWRNYARLVAFVSVDDRWREISGQCFDPTATVFIEEILLQLPHASRQQVAESFVFLFRPCSRC